MQSARIIFGTSVIILLLFSFPKTFGFRNNICSRETQPNCQDQPTNIYHRFDKHFNDNSIREVDVKRERLLQIRSLDNDRDLSTSRIQTAKNRLVVRERYSRISPESINRERINKFSRERSVDRRVAELRESRNKQFRERLPNDKDIRNVRETGRFSNDNSLFRTRDINQNYESQERREINLNRRTINNIRNNFDKTPMRTQYSVRREIRTRLIDNTIRTDERTRVFRERDQERERVSPERNIRISERRNDDRISTQRNIRSRSTDTIRVNERNTERTRIPYERLAERNLLSLERNIRISERRNDENDSTRQNIRTRSTESREFRQREQLLPERNTRLADRRNDEINSIRCDTRSRLTQISRISRERIQQRARSFPERDTTRESRLLEERNSVRRDIRSRSVDSNIRATQERVMQRERLASERDSRENNSDRRNVRSRSIDSNIRSETRRLLQGENDVRERTHEVRVRQQTERNHISERRGSSGIRERLSLETRNTNNIRLDERIRETHRMNTRDTRRNLNTQNRVQHTRFKQVQLVDRDSTLLNNERRNRILLQQSRNVRNSIRNLESRERHSSLQIRLVRNREAERNIRFIRESQERRENVIHELKEHLSRYNSNANSHKLLNRDTNRLNLAKATDRHQNSRLSRMSRNSERLTDNNRINVLTRDDTERLGNSERISDRRLEKTLSRKQKDGFQIIADQRDMNIYRLAYPTKVQDINLENQNIWINVVKILLACLLFLQISRSSTADLKMFKCIRIPIISQVFKEKVQ